MSLSRDVAALMRRVAEEVVVPRYRTLGAGEIAEKSPGEIVTAVDREAELRLSDGLARLEADARIVGEEACGDDPRLLDRVGQGLVWLVDPLDGTANFATGQGPFGMMIALVADGEPVASWMLDPLSRRMCHAERGLGAWIDGRPTQVAVFRRRKRPVAALATQFMDSGDRSRIELAARRRFSTVPIPRCAAESYPRLVTGSDHVALFQRILPWDHAAGVLFLNEAGGKTSHWDGSPYRVGSGKAGLIAASSDNLWEEAIAALSAPLADIGRYEPLAA